MVRYYMGHKVIRHYADTGIWYSVDGSERRFDVAAAAIDWIRAGAAKRASRTVRVAA